MEKDYDFGIKSTNGDVLKVGNRIKITAKYEKREDWIKEVDLVFEYGVFGFKDDDNSKIIIPISWHYKNKIELLTNK